MRKKEKDQSKQNNQGELKRYKDLSPVAEVLTKTFDRGITELINYKHRNGPVCSVKLMFEPQFTRLRN